MSECFQSNKLNKLVSNFLIPVPAVGEGRSQVHISVIHIHDILFNTVTCIPIAREQVGKHVSVDTEIKDVSVEIDSWK
jgi:hypothetical protein